MGLLRNSRDLNELASEIKDGLKMDVRLHKKYSNSSVCFDFCKFYKGGGEKYLVLIPKRFFKKQTKNESCTLTSSQI